MQKLFFIIAIILLIIIVYGLLNYSSTQKISTDKEVYTVGEDVTVFWTYDGLNPNLSLSDSFLYRYEEGFCGNAKPPQIFKQIANSWESISYDTGHISEPHYNYHLCIDGERPPIRPSIMPPLCKLPPKITHKSETFTWDAKMYESKGFINSCLGRENKIVSGNYELYESKNAPPGKYKIQFDRASTIIEIR